MPKCAGHRGPGYRDLVHIDHEGDEFPYVQLANLLRERIRSGEYPPGRAIPSVERIRQETGLAVKTIRRAIRVLEDEGLVVVRPGWGTFVAKSAAD